MSRYYNATRGPLALALPSGKSLSIPPKKWVEIVPGDEGSASLVALVRKGFLVRSKVPSPAPSEAVVAVAEVPVPVASPPSLPAPVSSPDLPEVLPPVTDKDKSFSGFSRKKPQ
jgi:hypothetical protein